MDLGNRIDPSLVRLAGRAASVLLRRGLGDGGWPGECIVPLCGALLQVSSPFPLRRQEEATRDFLCRHVVSDLGTAISVSGPVCQQDPD